MAKNCGARVQKDGDDMGCTVYECRCMVCYSMFGTGIVVSVSMCDRHAIQLSEDVTMLANKVREIAGKDDDEKDSG